MTAPQDDATELPLPPVARFLKRLVLVMAVVMIAAFVAIIAVAVSLLLASPSALPLPAEIALPAGARAQAFTQGSDWFAVVTDDDRILIYDRATSRLRQTVVIAAE